MQPIGEGNQPASVDDLNQGEFLLTRQKFFPFLLLNKLAFQHIPFLSVRLQFAPTQGVGLNVVVVWFLARILLLLLGLISTRTGFVPGFFTT